MCTELQRVKGILRDEKVFEGKEEAQGKQIHFYNTFKTQCGKDLNPFNNLLT